MSKADVNPFTPGMPVALELFTGRQAELEDLADRVGAAANGRLGVAFLTGERGIGKSTLANFVRALSEHRRNLLTVHAHMGGANTVEEAVRRVFESIAKDGQNQPWFSKVKKLFGERIQSVGLFGIQVSFQPEEAELTGLVNHFDTALRSLLDSLEGDKTGLLIVLDDINGLAISEEFAHWLKSFVDGVATSGTALPVYLMLVGLEERRRSLIDLNPSLARLFHLVNIQPWDRSETTEFFRKAFGQVQIQATDEALENMSFFAGGLPVLAHEIGDAAYRLHSTGEITRAAALAAILSAAEVVGRKHIEPQVFQAIRSPRYRRILREISKTPDYSFKRSDLIARLNTDEARVLDNFLRKMRDLGVLEQDAEEGAGWYSFTSNLHRAYFMSEASRSHSQDE